MAEFLMVGISVIQDLGDYAWPLFESVRFSTIDNEANECLLDFCFTVRSLSYLVMLSKLLQPSAGLGRVRQLRPLGCQEEAVCSLTHLKIFDP